MGNRPRHPWAWQMARRMVALTTVVALFIAPIVVILTHGPAAHAAAAGMAAELATHGHAHGDREDDIEGDPFAGHDATDHEHQLQALAVQSVETVRPTANGAQQGAVTSFQGLPRDGPKRPPRSV